VNCITCRLQRCSLSACGRPGRALKPAPTSSALLFIPSFLTPGALCLVPAPASRKLPANRVKHWLALPSPLPSTYQSTMLPPVCSILKPIHSKQIPNALFVILLYLLFQTRKAGPSSFPVSAFIVLDAYYYRLISAGFIHLAIVPSSFMIPPVLALCSQTPLKTLPSFFFLFLAFPRFSTLLIRGVARHPKNNPSSPTFENSGPTTPDQSN
jgi:hypothetical protein